MVDDDDDADNDNDCREMVSSFFIPADNDDSRMDCAEEPIRLTLRDESIEGRMEELNKALFITH